jgi:hypothetical protein
MRFKVFQSTKNKNIYNLIKIYFYDISFNCNNTKTFTTHTHECLKFKECTCPVSLIPVADQYTKNNGISTMTLTTQTS